MAGSSSSVITAHESVYGYCQLRKNDHTAHYAVDSMKDDAIWKDCVVKVEQRARTVKRPRLLSDQFTFECGRLVHVQVPDVEMWFAVENKEHARTTSTPADDRYRSIGVCCIRPRHQWSVYIITEHQTLRTTYCCQLSVLSLASESNYSMSTHQ